MAQLQNLNIDDTGFIEFPQGTTAERGGPVVEFFTATGSATFNVPVGVTQVEVLVVAGGGGTGACQYHNGGGGGGGVVHHTTFPVTPGGTVPVVVGTGGAGGAGPGPGNAGSNGADSIFGTLTAKGGGRGGHYPDLGGAPGGSGGGGAGNGNGPSRVAGDATQPGTSNPGATVNAGFPGGTGVSGPWAAGGGGGAGGAGTNGSGALAGDGGPGVAINMLGTTVFYGGGGGGSSQNMLDTGTGGVGGGGNGGSNEHNPEPQTANGRINTGGGAGGLERYENARNGADGGPGIVIVKYSSPVRTPVVGETRYNTESGQLEVYNGTYWDTFTKTVVSFDNPGGYIFNVPPGVTNVEVLVVGGGGSGGILGGGGGAGGYVYTQNYLVEPGSQIPVKVGEGGQTMPTDYHWMSGLWVTSTFPGWHSAVGQPSHFGQLRAIGGGGGGTHPGGGGHDGNGRGSPGGSGGGAAYTWPGNGGRGTLGQGFPGGSSPGSPPHAMGGGGGAGGAGGNGGGPNAGDGGAGLTNNISGVSVTYAGGGGGGSHGPQSGAGNGSPGGGGGGGRNSDRALGGDQYRRDRGTNASPGLYGTGGGGGGGGHNGTNPYGSAGNGAPGVVIIRY